MDRFTNQGRPAMTLHLYRKSASGVDGEAREGMKEDRIRHRALFRLAFRKNVNRGPGPGAKARCISWIAPDHALFKTLIPAT